MTTIKKEFRYFVWMVAVGKFSLILLAYVILIQISRTNELNNNIGFKIFSLFPILYLVSYAYNLTRSDNPAFYIITEYEEDRGENHD